MAKLRKLALILTWTLYLFCTLAYLIVVLIVNNGEFLMGPGGIFWHMTDLEKFVFFLTRGIIFEVPDWFSIALYMSLRRHFKKSYVHPAQVQQESVENNDEGVFPAGAFFDEPENLPELPPPNPIQSDPSHEIVKVMKILRLHLVTSFVKFLLCFIHFVPNLSAKIILVYHSFLISAFWIPLVVVKANFSQMDNMLGTFCQ